MRFVVVEIPDNQEALDFIKAVTRGALYYAYEAGDGDVGFKQPEGWTVPQAYGVPTMFCECEKRFPEAKSKKLGWYVCVNCSKPRKGSMQHPFNLMEGDTPANERVYYMGFRADRKGWILREKQNGS